MIRLSPGEPATRRGGALRSFVAVVRATTPTKVAMLSYLELVGPRQKWRKSSLGRDEKRPAPLLHPGTPAAGRAEWR